MKEPSPITTQPDGKVVSSSITSQPDGKATGIKAEVSPAAPTLSPEGYRTAPDHTNTGWPAGVPFIVGNEACERFSFYGMRAILYVHLVSLYAAQVWISSDSAARGFATATVHLFIAGVYALPMIGALMADRWAGKYRIIFYLSLVYCLGHVALSLYERHLWGMYLGLGLIAVGSGGIKPCVSANVGDQFGKSNWFRVRTIYQIFYFSINFGSFFATLLIPFLKDNAGSLLIGWFPGVFGGFNPGHLGTSVAFGVPGVLMFLATFVFWLGRRKFVHVPAKPGGKIGLLDTCCSVALFLALGHLFFTPEFVHKALEGYPTLNQSLVYWAVLLAISAVFLALGLYLFVRRQRLAPDDGFMAITLHVLREHLGLNRGPTRAAASNGQTAATASVDRADSALASSRFWAPAVARFGLSATEGPVAVFKIISVFFLISVFWALFDQHSSTWIEQASNMNLRLWGDRESFLGIANQTLKPSQVPALNPLMVMLLIPLMNLVYHLFDRAGIRTTPLRRVSVGMFITASSFVACALLQQRIDHSPNNSVWFGWQLVQYLLITTGEVMVSITGLEFAYTQAPKKMKSTIMGFWLLTVTVGNVLVAMLATVQKDMSNWVATNVVTGLSEPATFFWVFASLSAIAALIFSLRAIFYIPKDYAQE
jgi:POT family proton-dependent oligopeptide transporter